MNYLLGIDGGGSKTIGALCDTEGNLLDCVRTRPLTLPSIPTELDGRDTLFCLVDELCRRAGISKDRILSTAAGINGVDLPDDHEGQHKFISDSLSLPSRTVLLVNDAIIALWGAANSKAVAMVQHGGGFTAAHRSEYGREEVFDSLGVGMAYDIRRELMTAMVRMIDGRLPETGLKTEVLSYFGVCEPKRFAELLFRGKIDRRKALATPPLIFKSWENGDETARHLIESAARDYACALAAMLRRTGSPAAARLGGGVIKFAPPRFMWLVRDFLLKAGFDVEVASPDLPPELGALVMAAFHAGIDPVPVFEKLLKQKQSSICNPRDIPEVVL